MCAQMVFGLFGLYMALQSDAICQNYLPRSLKSLSAIDWSSAFLAFFTIKDNQKGQKDNDTITSL